MIELNVQDLRKRALIKFSLKPEGHVFTVREANNGDDLALSELSRERGKLMIKASDLQSKMMSAKTEEDLNTDIMSKQVDKILTDIDKLTQKETFIRSRVFDDGEDGKLAIALYNELSEAERNQIIKAVINAPATEA